MWFTPAIHPMLEMIEGFKVLFFFLRGEMFLYAGRLSDVGNVGFAAEYFH